MYRICMTTSIHPDFDARIYKMARTIADSGFHIELICPWDVSEGMRDGIYFRPFTPVKTRIGRIGNYPTLWRMISDREYDLYHFHDLDILPLFAFFRLIKNKPVIYDVHENYADEMRCKPYVRPFLRPLLAFSVYWGERLFARIIRNLIVVVDSLEKEFSGPGFHVVKVRNFATMELLKGRNENYEERDDAIIFTGSQYLGNGSLLFLEIARKIHAIKPHVRFYSIDRFGEDEQFRKTVIDTIGSYGLGDVMTMLPNLKPHEIMSHINRATIGISPNLNLPNQMKGIHTKMFEYMAGGIPIVASNHPYHVAFIEKQGAGLLADPDSPDEFTEKILHLLNDRKKAGEIGKTGLKAFKENFCWEEEGKKIGRMYRSILESRVTDEKKAEEIT